MHVSTYAPSVANIATAVWEDTGSGPSQAAVEAYRAHIDYELAGADQLPGTYPFTLERSFANYRVNDFLHRLIEPAHRERFRTDFDALAEEFALDGEEIDLIKNRKWIEMIRRGISFFVLEKMAAVLGVPNPRFMPASVARHLSSSWPPAKRRSPIPSRAM
jgi:gallate dioxygenase